MRQREQAYSRYELMTREIFSNAAKLGIIMFLDVVEGVGEVRGLKHAWLDFSLTLYMYRLPFFARVLFT